MKKITIFLFVMLFSGFVAQSYGISVPVTFQVDMSNQFVSADGVHIAGDFTIPWDPAAYELTDEGGGIYSITLYLSIGSYVEYKFINGNDWPFAEAVPDECAQNTNRFINVSTAETLDPVCFGTCGACEPASFVTFTVNMQDQEVTDGVYIAGSFQGWNATATPMTLMEDAYYSVTVILPIGEAIEYKFVNSGWDWENVPGCCNQNGNRYLTVPDAELLVDPVCFGNCFDCTSEVVEVTLQVNMSNEEVSPDGVHLVGNFPGNEWNPAGILMTDMGNNVFASTQELPFGHCLEYKFVNGDEWGEDESVPEECSIGWNRYLLVEVNQILNPVCFGSCTDCVSPSTDLFISEYAEGSSSNKYIEIYNGTGAAVDLAAYQTHRIANGGDWDENVYAFEPIDENTILQDGEVYVIANSGADDYIKNQAREFSTLTYFNGDDAVGLSIIDDDSFIIIDKIGDEGSDPGSGWDVAGVSNATKDHTLVRKDNVCGPNDDWPASAGTDAGDSEWIVYPQNYWDNLGFHVSKCGNSPSADMPVFSVPSGLVVAPFDLTITCATPGSVIYYTTDGSDPDFTSAEYIAAIPISENTVVKAIAYAAGFQASLVAEASYQFPVEVFSLAELRAAYDDSKPVTVFYQIATEVFLTFQQDFRGQKFIEDASAAVLIDDNDGIITTSYAIGDGITGIIGTLGEYGNMLQFVPAFDPGPATSNGTFIVPQFISLNELFSNFEEYESELVKIDEILFADAGANFSNGTVYEMSDDAKSTGNFRTTFYGVDYIGTAIPDSRGAYVGIPNSRFDGDYFTSRDMGDIVTYIYPMGWTGISSNVIPEGSPLMEDVFAPILDDIVILIGHDGMFWPGENINTIGDFNNYEGYKIKFGNEVTFEFEGLPLDDRTVTLEPGTHYIPVLSEEPASVEDVIVPLGDAIEFVFDIRFGLIYWPAGGILPGMSEVSLNTLYPGFAYLTYVNSTATLDFDVDLPKGSMPMTNYSFENKTPWNDVILTGDQHIISIMETASFESGDVIGVFNADGTCTGMSMFKGNETVLPLVVYADDQTTKELDGMYGGEIMTMKIFRSGEVVDVTPVYDVSFDSHDGLFANNGLSVISELKLGPTGIGEPNAAYSIYPNPGNGLFNISIDGEYTISVSNAHGQQVMTTNINGNYMLDLSNQPNGIYFIQLTNQTSSLIEKVIIR